MSEQETPKTTNGVIDEAQAVVPLTIDVLDALAGDYLAEKIDAKTFMDQFELWARSKGMGPFPDDGYYNYKLSQWYIGDDITRDMMTAGMRARAAMKMKGANTYDEYLKVLDEEGLPVKDRVNLFPTLSEREMPRAFPVPALEAMAEAQHVIWSHWMKYLFSKCEARFSGLHIPEELVERWTRQMETRYQDLSEDEKDSDRQVVSDHILTSPLLEQALVGSRRTWEAPPRVSELWAETLVSREERPAPQATIGGRIYVEKDSVLNAFDNPILAEREGKEMWVPAEPVKITLDKKPAPKTEQVPSIGRVVHYYQPIYHKHCAAIITQVHTDETVDLIIFPPGDPAMPKSKVQMDSGAGMDHQVGTWHWPEYVPARKVKDGTES